ncbi:MAG: hypothetical protein KF787_00305 [Phycisphaeraceae bacterium]|nr:hypothetical protein [Phycisphaerae bacterium]MBX3391065.1 hypothetical protein [Phycisphaeraceae bacterium]HRJ50007.1 helix-hairpin-helix domain-containing protein [Phycisphaerales bacterium]
MIHRIEGTLSEMLGTTAVVRLSGGVWVEALLPAYLARALADRVGQPLSLYTHAYLEGQGQGTSFIPRLIGFETIGDRRFFEVFTTVKGIGNRKALRAMEVAPAEIARAIADRDTAALVRLPEIGKRLAETIVAELHGKVAPFLDSDDRRGLDAASSGRARHPEPAGPRQEAVAALVALGETRADAERKVEVALARHGGADPTTADEVLVRVYAGG